MADRLSEQDEVTLRTMAFIERTSCAEQRRRALRAYAAKARRDKNVAKIVEDALASREQQRERERTASNVIQLRRSRG